ncbi:MAG: hypothetical protein JW915_04750 [Chitinispirillaceae bacterium]|nr:hypothetical protein [Chitinispirillaceae bacterium]
MFKKILGRSLIVLSAAVVVSSWGTDRVVSSSGPYTTIQAAIDAAASGDRILIAEDVNSTSFTIINKSYLTIQSMTSETKSIKVSDANFNNGSSITINNLRIEFIGGGDFSLTKCTNIRITNCDFRSNDPNPYGNGIVGDVKNFYFLNNKANLGEPLLELDLTGNLYFNDNDVTDGAILITPRTKSSLSFFRNTINGLMHIYNGHYSLFVDMYKNTLSQIDYGIGYAWAPLSFWATFYTKVVLDENYFKHCEGSGSIYPSNMNIVDMNNNTFGDCNKNF